MVATYTKAQLRLPYDHPERVASRARGAYKKRRERMRAKARRLGYDDIPPWIWWRHDPECRCYDCLWRPLPWEDPAPDAWSPDPRVRERLRVHSAKDE